MPGVIVPETMAVDRLPGIWSPVQWELTEPERRKELEDQAQASLLAAVDVPEAILRLLLDETQIERVFGPPTGYDPDQQGEWDDSLVTFAFKRAIKLIEAERDGGGLTVTYQLEGAGTWVLEIEPEKVSIGRI